MPDYTIKGNNTIEFGASGGATGVGVIISASRKDGGDKLELRNADGNIYCVVYFNDKDECEVKVIFSTSITLPLRGAAVTIGGALNCLVDEIEHNWEQGKERGVTIRATKYAFVILV